MKTRMSFVAFILIHIALSEGRLINHGAFNTLDIRETSRKSVCKSIQGIFDGIPATIFFPISGLINHVVDKNQTIWLPDGNDEAALCSIVYLRNGQPNLVHIVVLNAQEMGGVSTGKRVSNIFFKQKGGKWVPSRRRYAEKMQDLELELPLKSAFPLDINYVRSNYLYKNMNLTAYGKDAILFIPNPGYRATEIVERGRTIWKASGSYRALAVLALNDPMNGHYAHHNDHNNDHNDHSLEHYGRSTHFGGLYIISRNNSSNIEHMFLTKNGTEWIPSPYPNARNGCTLWNDGMNNAHHDHHNGHHYDHKMERNGKNMRGSPLVRKDIQAVEVIAPKALRGTNDTTIHNAHNDETPFLADEKRLYGYQKNLNTPGGGKEWVETPKKSFFGQRNPKNGLVLDLGSDYNPFIRVYEDQSDSIDYTMFTPKNGRFISSIVDNGRELWTARHGEKCMQVHLFESDGTHMVELDVESDGAIENIYLSKTNGIWDE